jgi:hypothetical protein
MKDDFNKYEFVCGMVDVTAQALHEEKPIQRLV